MNSSTPPSREVSSLLADTALVDASLDRLDRVPFATSLSQSVLSLTGDDSFVVALCGPWGSGKTSVLNFLLSDLESSGARSPIILKFNPWWFSGRQQLLESFLAQFGARLQAPENGSRASTIAKLLSHFSSVLRPLSLLPGIGEAARAAMEATKEIAAVVTDHAEASKQDVVAIREQIDSLLRALPQRIIVVMDDIDRMAADEIAQLFLIIKAVADFPRTIYLLSFDHRVVTQAIKNNLGVDGKAYLEKIVQLQIDIPPTAQSAIHKMFLEQLNELLKVDSDFGQSESRDFWNLFHDGLKHFLTTPRAVKKFINMLRFCYPPLRGEVRIVDMIGVACLSTFAPKAIPIIAASPDHFVGTGPSRGLGHGDELKRRKDFHRKWLATIEKPDRKAVERITRRLFPAMNHVLGGSSYSPEIESRWRNSLRICSDAHFEKYFRLSVPTGAISEHDWKEYISLLSNEDAFTQTVLALVDLEGPLGISSRAAEFLDRALEFSKSIDKKAQIYSMFRGLMRAGDRLCQVNDTKTVGGLFALNNRQRLIWVLTELLEKLDSPKDRQALVSATLELTDVGPLVLTELILSLGTLNGLFLKADDHEMAEDGLLTKSFLSKAARRISSKLESASQGLTSHPAFMDVAVNWWRIGNKKKAKNWITSVTRDDQVLVQALCQMASVIRSQGMDDLVAEETPTIDSGFLANFLDLRALRSRCTNLLTAKPSWLDSNQSQVLRLMIDAISPQGEPVSHRERRFKNAEDQTNAKRKTRNRKPIASAPGSAEASDDELEDDDV